MLTLFLAGLVCYIPAGAAEPSGWQGEWGQFTRVANNYRGGRLLITDCEGETCHASIATSTGTGGHASGEGVLRLDSGEVTLGAHCRLLLRREAERIEVKADGAGCGNYIAAGGALDGTFPLRSRNEFFGDNIAECYIGDSKARMAVCGDRALADLHKKWDSLRWEIAERESLGNQYHPLRAAWTAVLARCDRNATPAACLRAYLEPEIAATEARLRAWNEASVAPGDPRQAAALIGNLVGSYSHRFQSGTVDGSGYTATDSLILSRASPTALKFTVHLNFFNGHECNLEGTAEFKQSGHFVYREDACVLEIVPGPKRIELRDQGNCRESSCGLRGGYNGAGFDRASRRSYSPPGSRQ